MRRAVREVTTLHRGSPPRVGTLCAAILAIAIAVSAVVVLHGSGPSEQPRPTRSSAASAALRFVQLLAVAGVRDRSVFGPSLKRIAAPGAVDRVRETLGAGAEQVRGLLGRSGVLRAAPLGYRVDAFVPPHATVTVWMVALAGGARMEPVAQWRLMTIELVWSNGTWRVESGHGGPGPSPLSQLPILADEAATFREVRHVP